MSVIGAARSLRSEHGVHPTARVPLRLRTADPALAEMLGRESRDVEWLVRSDGPPVVEAPAAERPRGSVLAVGGDVEVLVGLRGLVDPRKERERVERLLKRIEKDLASLEKRLENPNFARNAPPEVVEEARAQKSALELQRERLLEALALVKELEN